MGEIENLIMCVEKYPCLWDINDADYHNRDMKDLAWQQICKEVVQDWETFTDKTNKCADLKKKWTNVRDYYRKEVQKAKTQPTGSGAKKSKKYVYDDLLYFLLPIFSKRDSQGNYPTETLISTQPQVELETEEGSIEPEDIHPIVPAVRPVVKNIQKKNKNIPGEILNILQQRQISTAAPSSVVEDDDTKFLLSFRSYMRKMNTEQKLDFKLGMLQLVKKINMSNFPSPSISPSPTQTSYTSVPQISPYYNILSPPPTFVPDFQQHIPSTSSSNPRIRIHSITNVKPYKMSQQNLAQQYSENNEDTN